LRTLGLKREELRSRAEFRFDSGDGANLEGGIAILRVVEALRLEKFSNIGLVESKKSMSALLAFGWTGWWPLLGKFSGVAFLVDGVTVAVGIASFQRNRFAADRTNRTDGDRPGQWRPAFFVVVRLRPSCNRCHTVFVVYDSSELNFAVG
jgi:hypothetical protein